jgi:phosphomannomutase
MTEFLTKQAPAEIGGEKVSEISQRDGVKYIMSDDSWLLIRPSGTEPVLRAMRRKDTHDGQVSVGIWRTGCDECVMN